MPPLFPSPQSTWLPSFLSCVNDACFVICLPQPKALLVHLVQVCLLQGMERLSLTVAALSSPG